MQQSHALFAIAKLLVRTTLKTCTKLGGNIFRSAVHTEFNKRLSYRKETVRLLHDIEIRVLHYSHIVLIGLFQSNRDHRLTFRSVIIEQWMYTAQVPINNTLVLSNVCDNQVTYC